MRIGINYIGYIALIIVSVFIHTARVDSQQTIVNPQQTMSNNIQKLLHRIYASHMSPYCPGRTLENCPSELSKKLRDKIANIILSGGTEEDVKKLFIEEYGDPLLSYPEGKGFAITAWIVPMFFLLISIGFLIIWIRRNIYSNDNNI